MTRERFLSRWPTYDDKSLKGDIGVAVTKLKVANNRRWAFRDKPQIDVGIDGEIEIREPNGAMRGRIISTQIKCGKTFFRAETETGFRYRPKPQHLNYWLSHTTPVVLVLVDDERQICYWQHIHSKNLFSVGGVPLVEVPKEQTLEAVHAHKLKDVARGTQQIDIVEALFKIWLAESSLFTATWNNPLRTPREFHGYQLFCDNLPGRGITCASVILGRPRIEIEQVDYLLSMALRNHEFASCEHALIGLASASPDAIKHAALPKPPRSSRRRMTVEYVPLLYTDGRFPALEEVDGEGKSIDNDLDMSLLDQNSKEDRRRNDEIRSANRFWGSL